jgi:phage gp46-like protein
MGDITTLWNTQTSYGDWAIIPGDLQGGDDLETSVLISFFTDRRAGPSDVIPDGTNDRRGWWGDAGQQYPIGSRLWLLGRAKQIPKTLTDAQGYCTEALQWMIDDGVIASASVACSWIGKGAMGIVATLYNQDGSVMATYQWAWKGLS